MPVELKIPSVGESITEVQIGEWLKSPGDAVHLDEPIVVIETDKVTVELPAPASGVMSEIRIQSGETAEVGDVIGSMEEGDAPEPAPATTTEQSGPAPSTGSGAPAHVMPAAQRALAEHGLSAEQVTATGPGGRLLKEDVERHAKAPASGAQPAPTQTVGSPSTAPAAGGAREEEVVPMTPMRKRIAARLVQSQAEAATLTTFNEIDLSRVVALRREHKERFIDRHGVKLGFMSFFVKAAVEALKLIPQVNAEVRGDSIVYRNYYDVGIAVGGGKGLVVPILRNAERMSFAQIELAIADFAARAKSGKLTLDELTGGTFTISNGGVYGSMMSTPILNPPQSGILGLHNIQERPVVRNGEIVARPMMYVALSYDHRVIDGRESVTFLKTIKEALEDPARMLLEI